MDKRIRSPNYPSLSLPVAIDKVSSLYATQHTHAAPREVIVKGMGYNTLNGASASAISALHKYGLLEGRGEEWRVSERALRILHPHSPEERAAAIKQAAADPPLFSELNERFPGKLPSDELLRNYLIRRGFAPGAVTAVMTAYRETSEMVEREAPGHDSLHQTVEQESSPMMETPAAAGTPDKAPTFSWMKQVLGATDERERPIGRYDYEDGSYVRIVAGGDLDTEEALEMVETLIALKRAELKRRKAQEKRAPKSAIAVDQEEDIDL
jgi:hypothetical protein